MRPVTCSGHVHLIEMASKIKTLAVIGSGLMGSGIAQVAAQTGHKVVLVDMNDQILGNAKKRIEDSLTRLSQKAHPDNTSAQATFVSSALGRISTTTDRKKAVSGDCDLVIEAIRENLADKQELFAELDKCAPKHTLFASNTSSLIIAEIAKAVKRQDQFGGMHFFSPVPMMKLVEVIKSEKTSIETQNTMFEFAKKLDKTPIRCKDTPGFVVNRLLIPYLLEAARLVERGDATIQDVDTAMKLGAGYPMGPFTLMDAVGLDVNKLILDAWHEREPNNPMFKPIGLLEKLVKDGKLGMKTGEGFHKYRRARKS